MIRKAIVLENFVSHEFHYFSMNTSFRDPAPLRTNWVKVDPEIENKSMYLQNALQKKLLVQYSISITNVIKIILIPIRKGPGSI